MSNRSALQRRTVRSGDVDLAVWEVGDPTCPTVVAVHGFPDTHTLWDGVALRLGADRFHVVSYDVRGAGETTAPDDEAAYVVELLVDDLIAVLDATLPDGRRAHLLGHDWGSVQLWEAVLTEASDDRLTGRIASFTSLSGPSLDQFGDFLRTGLRRHGLLPVASQLLRSSYAGFFQLPVVPELAMRRLAGHTGTNGVNLYRANALAAARRPSARRSNVPVQLVVATRDPFFSPAMYEDTARWASNLKRADVEGGHWLPRTHGEQVAGLVADFVRSTELVSAGPAG